MKKLMAICLALAAMASFGAVSAASASAATFDFSCNIDTECFVHGEQKTQNVFRVNGGAVLCTTATFLGRSQASEGGTTVQTEPSGNDWAIHTLVVHPTYGGCTFNGQTAVIDTEGCNYLLTATSRTTGTVGLQCGATPIKVTVTTAGCTVSVGTQTVITNGNVEFASEEAGGKKDVLVTAKVGNPEIPEKGKSTGIVYTSTGGACGESGSNGSYRGSVTTKGYSSSKIEAANQVSATVVETLANGKITG